VKKGAQNKRKKTRHQDGFFVARASRAHIC
jgi:hypothetical protein